MADLKPKYGTTNQAVTINLASLASSATVGREGAIVDNSTSLFIDALVMCQIKTQNSGTIGNESAVYVYAYGTVDTSTPTYPDAVTGADTGITLNAPTQLKLLGVINVTAINTTYKGGPWGLAALFGGMLPQKWGIVVRNYCGTALSATAGDHKVLWQGVQVQSV